MNVSDIVAAWAEHGAIRSLAVGECIYRAGDEGQTMFGLLEGSVRLERPDAVSEVLEAGDCFGEGALAQADHRRFTTATAETDIRLAEIDRERFCLALEKSPVFGLMLIASMSRRLRALKGSVV